MLANDEGGARWSTYRDGVVERVDLLDGSLAIRMSAPSGGRRVVVRVPDGEIEDIGTVFHVTVANGRTSRVHVDEGRVIVPIGAAAPILLGAGERAGTSGEVPRGRGAIHFTASTARRLGDRDGVRGSLSSLPPSVENIGAAGRPKAPESAPLPSASDGAEEDRACFQVVRLLREGRGDEAKAAARDYVRRFPSGFRRAEMERVVSDR